jgi:hypothetical protein
MVWPVVEKKHPGGRPKGSKTKGIREYVIEVERPKQGNNHQATVADIRRRAALSGDLPHEFLLKIARGETFYHDGVKVRPTIEMRIDCAKAAAPYFAPKLAQVDVIKTLTDDDLDTIIKNASAETGIGLSFGGEGPQTSSTPGTPPAPTTKFH